MTYRGIVGALAVLVAFSVIRHVGNERVFGQELLTGEIKVQRGEPYAVIEGPAAVVWPGERVTLRVTGEVDLNPETKSKRVCKILDTFDCSDVHWVEHNLRTPAQHGAEFVFSDQETNTIAERQTVTGETTFIIQGGWAAADRPRRLLAFIPEKDPAGNLVTIDRGRSTGWYSFQITVDSKGRLDILKEYYWNAERPM